MNMAVRAKGLIAAVALLALSGAAGSALAGGFQLHEQSAEYQGMSFAGTAAGGMGLSSMFWNPATITQHSGWKDDINGTLVDPYSRARDETGGLGGVPDSGNIGKLAFIPASYDSYQINEMFWIGMAMNSPFGMATRNSSISRGALYGYKSKIFTFNVNPMVGVKLSDMISLGFGLQVNYMKGNLSNAVGGTVIAKVKGNDWGLGFTAGLTLTPTETTTIGIGYRSRIKHKLKGSYFGPGVSLGPASVDHTLPDQFTVSVRQQISPDFALLGTVEWTNWSLFKSFIIKRAGVPVGGNVYNWKDSWMFSVGGEYKYSDALVLRAGYAYERSPVPDATRGVRVPDNNRHWLSLGASYVANDWVTFHAGYSHLFVKKAPVNITAPAFTATYKSHVNIFSVSATVDPAKLFAAH